MKTTTILEKLQGVESDSTNPADDAHYQETVSLLLAWDGTNGALLRELTRRSRARKMPTLPALDMSNQFDDAGVQFVAQVERVAERLRVDVTSPAWNPGTDATKSEFRQESATALRLRERFK